MKKVLAGLLFCFVFAFTACAEEASVASSDQTGGNAAVVSEAETPQAPVAEESQPPAAEEPKAPVLVALELWLEGKDEEAFNICESNSQDYLTQVLYSDYLLGTGKVADTLRIMKRFKKLQEKQIDEKIMNAYYQKILQSANENNVRAAFLMGKFERGIDENKSIAWFRKAAEKGNAAAAFFIGVAYNHGNKVKKDAKEAFKWFKKSADGGFSQALIEIGLAYNAGRVVKRDLKAAFNYYLKGAQLGDSDGLYQVGWCFYNGNGVKKDLAEAAKWYRKAAELNDEDAQYDLAMMYHLGKGVQHDAAEAKKWAKLAADNGHEKAKALYDAIVESEKYMTCTAKKMLSDLNDNALAANDDYMGKYVKVTGVLSVIDSSGRYIVIDGGGLSVTGINCKIMTKEQRDKVKKLKRNQKITVLGKVVHVGEVVG